MVLEGFSMSVVYRRCTREHYDEMIRAISVAFTVDGPGWIYENLGHICPPLEKASDEDVNNHYIALVEGKVAAAVGCYCRDWIISDKEGDLRETLKIGGIGQVVCLPDYRKSGHMTNLLKMAIADMTKDGLNASWLSGDRIRYAHFGWDRGGNNLVFSFGKREFEPIFKDRPSSYEIKAPDKSDIELLDELYTTLSSRIVRTESMWQRIIESKNINWKIIRCGNNVGYIVFKKDKSVFIEAAGDILCIMHGASELIKEINIKEARFFYPLCEDDTAMFMNKHSKINCEIKDGVNLNIFNIENTFAKLRPFIQAQIKAKNLPEAYCESILVSLNNESKCVICKKLLGFVYSPLPDSLKAFAFLEPVAFWLSQADNV